MSLVEKVEDTTNSPLFTLATLSFLVGGGYAKYFKGAPTWNPYVITGCTMLTIALIADWNFDRKWKGTSLQEWEAHYRDEELLWKDDFETIVPVPEEEGVYAATRINEPDVTYFIRGESVGGEDLYRILWIEEPDETIVVSEMAADWGGMNLTGGVDEIDEMLGKKKRAESFKDWADEEEHEHGDVSFEKWVQEEYEEPAHMYSNPLTFTEWARQERKESGHTFEAPYAFNDDRCDSCERSVITDQDMKRIPISKIGDDGFKYEYQVCEPCYEFLVEKGYEAEEEKPTKTRYQVPKEPVGHPRWLVGEGYSGRAKCKVCGEIIPKGQPTIDFHSTGGILSIHSRPEHCAVKRAESFAVEAYDESITVWICGACNRRFEDQNDAEACCEGLGEEEIPYFDGRSKELREVHLHEAETMGPPETVSKKGSVKTMSGKPHTPRKLTKDQDITPEEARKRVRLEAEQNPAAGAFHPSETMGEQIVRPDGPMSVDQAKGFMDNLRRYRKTMSAEGENEEIESLMDLVMEISVSEDLFDDLEYYYPEEWYDIFLSSYADPQEKGYQLVVIHEDDFDTFYEMRESLRYLPPSPAIEFREDMDLEQFWDEEAGN